MPPRAAASLSDSAAAWIAGVTTSSRHPKSATAPMSCSERWSLTANAVSRSTSSPHRSMRTGTSAVEGNTSTIPPRTANSPRCSTWCSRRYPRATRSARSAPSSTCWPRRMTIGAVPSGGPSRWSSARTGRDDHPRRCRQCPVGSVGQRVQDGQAAAHRLGLGADALEGQGLPRRQDGDRPVEGADDLAVHRVALRSEQAGQVVPQALGIEPRRRDHQQRGPLRERRQRGDHHGLRRLRDGHGGVGRPEDRADHRVGAQQVRDGGQAAARRVRRRARSGVGRGHRSGGQRVAPRHGGVDAVGCDALDRVGGDLHRGGEELPDGPGRALEHVGRARRGAGRLADTDADTQEVVRVEVVGNGAQAVVTGEAPARLEADRPGREVELVVDDDDGGRVRDSEALRQTRARRDRTRSCRWSARPGPPACPCDVATPTRAGTPFSARRLAPWRSASSVTASDPALCRLPANSVAGVPEPDDQQVRRGPPALGPGKGAAQGLALSARALGCLPGRLGGLPRCPFLALGALGALALGGDDTGRLADGDRRLGVDLGGDALRAA